MSSLSNCLHQTSVRLAQSLPSEALSASGRFLLTVSLAAAAAFSAPQAHAQAEREIFPQSSAGRVGERVGGVLGSVLAGAVLNGSQNSPGGRELSGVGRVVLEEVGRNMGRNAAEKSYRPSAQEVAQARQQLVDRMDNASVKALLAVSERQQYGVGNRSPGVEPVTLRMNRARDEFETLYRKAGSDRQDVSAWRPVQDLLRLRHDALTPEDLAAAASAPLARLQRPGGPGYQPTGQAVRVTMSDIHDRIDSARQASYYQAPQN